MVIGDDGRIEANDLQLSDGKTIILNNSNDDGSGDSLAINTLHIGPGKNRGGERRGRERAGGVETKKRKDKYWFRCFGGSKK